MYTKWTSHLNDEHAKAQFEIDIRRAKPVLDRLKTILERDREILAMNDVDFNSPAWPYLQAYTIGNTSILKGVIQLIDLDQQKDKT